MNEEKRRKEKRRLTAFHCIHVNWERFDYDSLKVRIVEGKRRNEKLKKEYIRNINLIYIDCE